MVTELGLGWDNMEMVPGLTNQAMKITFDKFDFSAPGRGGYMILKKKKGRGGREKVRETVKY